jgi:ATP-dependent Zn protease
MRGYETARQILQDYRPAMKAIAAELLEVESLDGDEFKALVERHRPSPDSQASIASAAL